MKNYSFTYCLLLVCMFLATPTRHQDPCTHPLTKTCGPDAPFGVMIKECVENASHMFLKSPVCRCQVGSYLVEADTKGPTRCQKCHSLCNKVCKGPPTVEVMNGIEVVSNNEQCPPVLPYIVLSSDQNDYSYDYDQFEFVKRYRFYLLGKPCYEYTDDGLDFYLPTPNFLWNVRQDYPIKKIPYKHLNLLYIQENGIPPMDRIPNSSCRSIGMGQLFFSSVTQFVTGKYNRMFWPYDWNAGYLLYG